MENTLEIKAPARRDYVYFRQRQKNKVFQSVAAFFAKQAEERGLTKKELARLLDKDPAQITRWLSGPGNWELDTISDLLLAMGAEMDFDVTSLFRDVKGGRSGPVTVLARMGETSRTAGTLAEPVRISG